MSVAFSSEEIGRRGEEIYQRDIRHKVENDHRGEFLVLDILSGDYEIAPRDVVASDLILERRPDAVL